MYISYPTDCDYGNGTYDVVIINKTQVAELRINITDDNVIESDETFRLVIDSTLPMQVTINGNRRTTVTIEDNEESKNQYNIVIYCVWTFTNLWFAWASC